MRSLFRVEMQLDRVRAREEPAIRLTDEIPLLIRGFICAMCGFVRPGLTPFMWE